MDFSSLMQQARANQEYTKKKVSDYFSLFK